MTEIITTDSQNELRYATYWLRRFVHRSNCREMPALIIDFKSNDDRARFVRQFECMLTPAEFDEGRRFGATEGLFITPCGISTRLTVNGR
ncbi:hypothetical protein [Bradyrhizobium sp. 150]|uniref:hypothetical protein n=1 Tax=Bradyrhizobium sp. 150 TaxID=2782625 RepID=UPI001FFB3FBB|nr:hypothetical protein [Bradyrhizobium sp. 150]MCK1671070.1 hypothetical protein [Bradyrhizobium sp. 150]